jgi:hypothetical protein
MQKILEGDLGRLEVPDVLTFLNLGRRTGVLALERPEQETKLFLREGNPVFATSTKGELRLGEMLVRMGKVKADVVERAASRPRSGRWRIGHVFLAEKVLTEAELASFLKVQVSEVIFDTFGWKNGLFTFWENVPPPATAVTLAMDLQSLLMEGSRRHDERGRLADVFPDHGMAVEAVANPERVKHSVTMTPEEWKVFFLADGRKTIGEIARLVGNPDELSTLEILHRLVKANLVTVVPTIPAAKVPTVDAPPGTVRPGDKPVAGAASAKPAAVEFQPTPFPKQQEDDTREIVTPKAVQYQQKTVVASRLILVADGGEQSFPLTRDAYTVGRHRNNDIVVSDAKVSSFHARLDRSPDGFVLVDLKSRNGSFVNGKRVETQLLKTGDEIRMGTAKLIYKVDYSAPAA